MRKVFIIFMLVFIFASNVMAENKTLPITSMRNNLPIQIKSDSLVADNAKKTATFTGKVAARQGDLTIYGDKLIVSYSADSKQIDKAEVFGNVRIFQGNRRAEASHGVYYAAASKIVLDGNAKVFQDNDTVSGAVITYYLDEDRSEVVGGKGGRVDAVIHPKGNQK
ncbi:MAG: lipopolysaccharide transport periplasmic protein LptA [Desulfuromonadales bacterium]|nr:lipopolysaccharide transport periplasmic protein LptA [Desulfuromonadales bacterium]